jgi:hypothetical protein
VFLPGDTFLAGEHLHGMHHLWVVINDPARHGGRALFVNVTTLSNMAELTCVLKTGEHPFVKHSSWVRYASAKTALADELHALEAKGVIIRRQPASSTLLAKIRAGASASPRLPQKFLRLL